MTCLNCLNFKKEVADLDENHRNSFYRAIAWHLSTCRNTCKDDRIYEMLLKYPCREQFKIYTIDNVPKFKSTGHRVKFNKRIHYNDNSHSNLSIATLFIVESQCNYNTLFRYDVSQKEVLFAGNCANWDLHLHNKAKQRVTSFQASL